MLCLVVLRHINYCALFDPAYTYVHIYIYIYEASPSDTIVSYQNLVFGKVLPLCRIYNEPIVNFGDETVLDTEEYALLC